MKKKLKGEAYYRIRRWCWRVKLRRTLFVVLIVVAIFYFYLHNFRLPVNYSDSLGNLKLWKNISKNLPAMYMPQDDTRIGGSVLVICKTRNEHLQQIAKLLGKSRCEYQVEFIHQIVPILTSDSKAFRVIVFDSFHTYISINNSTRLLLDKYCKINHVGIALFVHTSGDEWIKYEEVRHSKLIFRHIKHIHQYKLNKVAGVWRIARPGHVFGGRINLEDWTVFDTHHATYQPLAFANIPKKNKNRKSGLFDNCSTVTVAVLDNGLLDGIRRIYFGNSLSFWLHQVMLLDAVSYFSHGRIAMPIERLIQVDIDDIFSNNIGKWIDKEDAEALISSQERLEGRVEDFHFAFGFTGGSYKHGNSSQIAGDEKLLEYRHKFYWYPHSWLHGRASDQTFFELKSNMLKNFKFAKDHGIKVLPGYAVSPYHAGVNSFYEPLYKAWRSVWNISVTSFPRGRDDVAVSHCGILVLPRQTCELTSLDVYFSNLNGGRKHLDNSIRGGRLFFKFLFNPINIFMTHQENYHGDRLALHVIENAIEFVQNWTNLVLKQEMPLKMAKKYLKIFPMRSVGDISTL